MSEAKQPPDRRAEPDPESRFSEGGGPGSGPGVAPPAPPAPFQPLLPENFRTKLRQGKYTSWAENISFDQLQAVLWAVGEFACRAREEDYTAEGFETQGHATWEIHHPRQSGALKILIHARRRPGIGLDAAQQMIREANARRPAPPASSVSPTERNPDHNYSDNGRCSRCKGPLKWGGPPRAEFWCEVCRVGHHPGPRDAEPTPPATPVRLGMHTFSDSFSDSKRADDKDICACCGCHRDDLHHFAPAPPEPPAPSAPPKRHKYVGYEGTCLDCNRGLLDDIHIAASEPVVGPYECGRWPSQSLSKHGKDLPTICNELHARGREVVQAFPQDDGGWGVLHRARDAKVTP